MRVVHAVIVNYRQDAITRRAVECVLASEGIEPRVILIENDGDGQWMETAYAGDPRVSWRANPGNTGFGAACNQGIERALELGAELVCLINNDAEVAPDALKLLAGGAAAVGLSAPKILFPDGRIYAAGGRVELNRARCRNRGFGEPDSGQYDQPARMPFASGCALMIARKALDTGIRFHPDYFLYYEDADFCLRLHRAGFAVLYTPRAVVVHRESASTPPAQRHRLLYYNTRNRVPFMLRNARPARRIVGLAYLTAATFACALADRLRGRRQLSRARIGGLADGLNLRLGPLRR